MNIRSKIITKRRKNKEVVGWIRQVEYRPPWSCRYGGEVYELYGADGNLIAKSIDYNYLHGKLYSL